MYSIITAVQMHLSRFFQLKPIVRRVFRGAKKPDSIQSLLLSTTVLNDNHNNIHFDVSNGYIFIKA